MNNHKVTIKDIADAAGVSTALVSFVMNNKGKRYRVSEEMTRKIEAVAAELHYQPNNAARSLRSGRSWTIGVIVSDISNKFFADIARCIEDKAYEYNYTVIFGSSDENAVKLENLLQVMINKGVDGLIIVPCEGAEEAIKRVVEMPFPVVLLDRYIENISTSRIVLDNHKAMAMAVQQLIEQGYQRIELFSYDLGISNIREREQGYLEKMEQSGLHDLTAIHKIRFKHIPEDTQEVIRRLFALKEKPEALLFVTNTLTIAGLKVLKQQPVCIPEDIAVVGFDGNEAFELYYTSITHVCQPIEQFGVKALELLLEQIENQDTGKVVVVLLEPEIVQGESSLKRIPMKKRV